MTIYLDVPVEIGLARVNENRQGKIDRLDKESISFHQKVRETYLKLQSEFSDRIKIVDATQPLNKVIDDTLILINQILEDKS